MLILPMRIVLSCIVLSTVPSCAWADTAKAQSSDAAETANQLPCESSQFAMSNWFYKYKWGEPAAQIAILDQTGYQGVMLSLKDVPKRWNELPEYLDAIKKHGLDLTAIHCRVYIEDGTYPQVIKDNLPNLRNTGAILVPSVGSREENVNRRDPAKVAKAVAILREMAQDADDYGLGGVAPYMHIGNFVESLDDGVFIAEQVDRPNVGVMFHLHHWQHTAELGNYDRLASDLRRAAPRLKLVVIQGTDEDAITHKVVGEGTFDLRPLVATLRDIDYQGPVGSMGYTLTGDIPQKLQAGRRAWDELVHSTD